MNSKQIVLQASFDSQAAANGKQFLLFLLILFVLCLYYVMTLDHKTSHKGQFVLEIWQYLFAIQLFENLESEGAKKIEVLTIAFKVVQMKFLLMLIITNQTFSFYIFAVGHLLNIFMEHDIYLMSQWFLP